MSGLMECGCFTSSMISAIMECVNMKRDILKLGIKSHDNMGDVIKVLGDMEFQRELDANRIVDKVRQKRQTRTKCATNGMSCLDKLEYRASRSDKFTIVDLKRLKYLNYLLKEHGFMVSEDGCSAIRIK